MYVLHGGAFLQLLEEVLGEQSVFITVLCCPFLAVLNSEHPFPLFLLPFLPFPVNFFDLSDCPVCLFSLFSLLLVSPLYPTLSHLPFPLLPVFMFPGSPCCPSPPAGAQPGPRARSHSIRSRGELPALWQHPRHHGPRLQTRSVHGDFLPHYFQYFIFPFLSCFSWNTFGRETSRQQK